MLCYLCYMVVICRTPRIRRPGVATEEGRYSDHHPVGNTCADIRSYIFQIIDIYLIIEYTVKLSTSSSC